MSALQIDDWAPSLEHFLFSIFSGIIPERNSKVHHYFAEIVRNFNKLNFIAARTLRFMGNLPNSWKRSDPQYKQLYNALLYATYRYRTERTGPARILHELYPFYRDKKPYKQILETFIRSLKTFDMNKALRNKDLIERLSIEYAHPSFFIEKIMAYTGPNRLTNILDDWNKFYRDTLFTIRIRGFEIDPKGDPKGRENIDMLDRVRAELNVPVFADRHFSGIFHIPGTYKSKVIRSKLYSEKRIAIHDKASFIAALLINPARDELIWDIAAAPGVKNLIIQDVFKPKQIIASDISYPRLKKGLFRINRRDLPNILHTDGYHPPFRDARVEFDKIILDAPCTGSGTLYDNPILKWRQDPAFLERNVRLQSHLLENALKYLKKDGLLLYITCSLYFEEGEKQIIRILENNSGLSPEPLPRWAGSGILHPPYFFSENCHGYRLKENTFKSMARRFPVMDYNARDWGEKGQRSPHFIDYGTSGFFFALLRKK